MLPINVEKKKPQNGRRERRNIEKEFNDDECDVEVY
jgi:hypothetical protein